METSGIKEIKGIWQVRHKSQGLETSRKIKINNHNFYPQQLKNVDLRAEVQDLRTRFIVEQDSNSRSTDVSLHTEGGIFENS